MCGRRFRRVNPRFWRSHGYSAASGFGRVTQCLSETASDDRGQLIEAECAIILFMPDSSSELSLWKKQLGRVPDSVWEQTQLESLVLAENGLSEVSEQIGRLKRLGCSISDIIN
jgi:hypothetical protein